MKIVMTDTVLCANPLNAFFKKNGIIKCNTTCLCAQKKIKTQMKAVWEGDLSLKDICLCFVESYMAWPSSAAIDLH
jgi:hypothetical protein